MNFPTSQTVYAGERVTDHDELIRFLKFQQEQIAELGEHVRSLESGCVTLSTANNNGHQEIPDSPETGKFKTTPSQIAWQAQMERAKEALERIQDLYPHLNWNERRSILAALMRCERGE